MSIAKQIEGYPDYYVSSAGNVWREKKNEFYMRLRPNNQGLVNLYTNGERKLMLVHRIVAQAFVPVPEQYADMSIDELEVHHINFNHYDNRASNLQWLTKTEHKQLHSESEVTKQRLSEAKKGKHHTEETKRKLSEAKKGEKNPNYGKHLLEETRRKMSAARKGENNPMYGKHHTEDSRRNMSAALKGKQINRSDQSKVVIQYTKDGEFIAEYASTMEAERLTKVYHGSICSCCRGKLKSAGGYIWKYD